jgi:hypothetical protein
MELCEGVSHSAEGGGECFNELRFLFGEDGAQVKDEVVVFDACDYADCGGTAQALLELGGGVAGASDADDFCGKRLRRRGAASG